MNRFVNALLVSGFSLVLCRAGAADRFAFPQLPESPYVDTEISTNDARILWRELRNSRRAFRLAVDDMYQVDLLMMNDEYPAVDAATLLMCMYT